MKLPFLFNLAALVAAVVMGVQVCCGVNCGLAQALVGVHCLGAVLSKHGVQFKGINVATVYVSILNVVMGACEWLAS